VATVRYNQANIYRLLHSPAEGPHRKVSSVTRKTLAVAKATVKVDTGRLKNTHYETVTDEGTRLRGRVGATADYALAVHNGHKAIKPVNAKVLVFRIQGRLVFAKEVRATKGDPWLVKALQTASPWPVVVNPF
jgi:hypothetical protein